MNTRKRKTSKPSYKISNESPPEKYSELKINSLFEPGVVEFIESFFDKNSLIIHGNPSTGKTFSLLLSEQVVISSKGYEIKGKTDNAS